MRKLGLLIGVAPLLWATVAASAPILDFQVSSGGATASCFACAAGVYTNVTPGPASFTGGATGTFTVLTDGNVNFSGSVGNSTLNVTSSLGSPFLPTPQLILNTSNTTSLNGGVVTIEATDLNQTTTTPTTVNSAFSTSADAPGTTTGTFETFFSTSNALFGGTSLTGGPQTISGVVGETISVPGIIPAVPGGTLSGTIIVTLTQPKGNAFGYTSSINPVPEPASLALFGTALIGMGWVSRRRRKKA